MMRRASRRRVLLAMLVMLGLPSGCGDGAPPRSVAGPPPLDLLLITLDTFRADRAGGHGHPGGWTPWLDRAMRGAWLARNAYAPAPLTAISHATLLTGLEPYRHGVRENALFPLDPGVPTLAAHLRAHGLATAAFIAAFPLESRFGFANGFDTFDEDLGPEGAAGLHYAERRAHDVVDRALPWIAARDGSTRWFAWVHFFDPHHPYRPLGAFGRLPGGTDYEREIRGMDAELGRLLRGVEASGRDPVLAVVSDHGEGLGDHGEVTHGILLHEETMRGFLGIRVPPTSPAHGRLHGVHEAMVSYADLVPTLLDALDLPPMPDLDGRSVLGAKPREPGGVYGETYYPMLHYRWSPLLSWRDERWAFVDGPEPELYDRQSDPGETVNVVGRHPDAAEPMRAEIRAVALPPSSPSGALDAEAREKLGALGYLGTPAAAGFDATKNPKDHLDVINELFRGMVLASEGRFQQALGPLQRAYRADPDNAAVLFHLADCYRRLGNVDTAMDYYRTAIDKDPRVDEAWAHLALLRWERGRREEAVRLLEDGRRANPGSFALWMTSGDLSAEAGRADAARREYERAGEIAPDRAEPWAALARLASQRGDTAEARRLSERAAAAPLRGGAP